MSFSRMPTCHQQNCTLVSLCSGETSPPGTEMPISDTINILKRVTVVFFEHYLGAAGDLHGETHSAQTPL